MIEQKTRTLLLLDILTIYDAFAWIVMSVGCRSVEMSCLRQWLFLKSSAPLSQVGQITSRQLILLQILSRV